MKQFVLVFPYFVPEWMLKTKADKGYLLVWKAKQLHTNNASSPGKPAPG